jgi:hypothetical protein
MLGPGFIAQANQNVAHPLMRRSELRIGHQRALVHLAGRGVITGFEQRIAEIHERREIARMVFQGLCIRQTRSGGETGVIEQRSEVAQRSQVSAVALDHFDVRISRLIVATEKIERLRPCKEQRDILGVLRKPFFEREHVAGVTESRKHRKRSTARPRPDSRRRGQPGNRQAC